MAGCCSWDVFCFEVHLPSSHHFHTAFPQLLAPATTTTITPPPINASTDYEKLMLFFIHKAARQALELYGNSEQVRVCVC